MIETLQKQGGAGSTGPPPVRIHVLCNTRGFSIAQLKGEPKLDLDRPLFY